MNGVKTLDIIEEEKMNSSEISTEVDLKTLSMDYN